MDKNFHLFVRRYPGLGVAAHVLTHPHLASFAADLSTARLDLAEVVGRLLHRGELWDDVTHWEDLRQRRMAFTVRAMQHGRLLPVPLRLTVVTHGGRGASRTARKGDTAKAKAKGPLRVWVPRVGVEGMLHDAADLESYVEELVRHELYLAPLERLHGLAYLGEESVETLSVPSRGKQTPKARADEGTSKQPKRLPPPPGLAEASRCLNEEARAGLLERAWERDAEVARLAEAVTASSRASVLLVGPASVGKTALVHELVQRAEVAAVGHPLRGLEVYSTSGGRIMAGMRYLGQWQERVQHMVEALRVRRAVLHLDSLSELLSLGGGDTGLDVARHLLPALEGGEVALVLEATPEDVARAERTHGAFLQALRQLSVAPLAAVAARSALQQASQRVARARKVRFTQDALERAAELTERFGDGPPPGGAVALLRSASTQPSSTGEVDAAGVTQAFCTRTGYPRELVDTSVRLDPEALLRRFRERIVGQDEATLLLRNLIVTLKTGLADPSRPLGAFLLLGPTGVGKTESALALAEYLFGDTSRLARFDMAEYAAPGSAARLVGEVGGQQGGLARRVREQPFGVVLLDEVEKADAGVHDLLLQVLGEGRLTDGTGRTVSFRNTVVLLTSNLGADSAGRSLGFGGGSVRDLEQHYLGAATAFFRPELLNRLDQVVPYRPLTPDVIRALARRTLEAALAREGLTRRGVKVSFGEDVVEYLARTGFDARYGARPLKRAVEQHVVTRLAQWLAGHASAPPAQVVLRVGTEGTVELGP
ncbi:ATP-dependent Clp protease ATP-binding subunit [Corallococcus praedator]|uniref:ATP-dependent Clp protease ATP-binding subunit n=1 Tax=Corallococcus praedator TaxID=2316724 RepID=A0ABX9QN90_9BACT|nr:MULTISPECIES: AAA family ATPase [Corallococcus]RKH32845.1 ATP-dependent Clp protease ATP-binding subunit [Corallococcus sp. CA031C]RKI11935.1 ATP-dependent Clp protease ATP-binding subunit [Corallococcus praedator]